MADDLQVSRIRQIAVTVGDVSRTLPFYRDVLGLPFLFSAGPDLAFLSVGDIRIMLSTPQGHGTPGSNSVLFFEVPNAEAAHDEMVKRGAVSERAAQFTAQMADHELWIAFIRDPDGNLIGLMEERR